MPALRVGLFTECYRPIQNGVVASVDALAGALRARDHVAVVVTPRVPHYRDEVAHGVVRVASLPLPTRTAYRLTVPYLSRACGPLAIAHAHSPFVTGAMAYAYARRHRVPLVYTYHTRLEAYAHYVPFEGHTTRFLACALTRAYANAADVVIAPTATMQRRLRALGVRARIETVPSGIDVARFAHGRRRDDVRARLCVAPNERLILVVGRLGREKNVEFALAAFARLRARDARLVVVGDGTHRAALEREAVRLGIAARTTFARERENADLPDIYASADAFVFPSRSETQGLVLVEALAAGVPIVALDTPQTRDVLGPAGRLVRDDPAACAAALERSLADGFGHVDGRLVANRFDHRTVGERMIAIYESVLTPRP